MAKSKYDAYEKIIMDLYSQGKKATEIAKFLNEENAGLNAEESGLRAFIKKNESETIPETKKTSSGKELSGLIEKMKKKHSVQKAESILQGKLLQNLEILKLEYQDVTEKHSILNETLHETILRIREENNQARFRYLIAAGWILTMLFAMFAGYYIGRCYSRPAFHYILTLTGIPAGVFIGLGLAAVKKAIKKKA